MNDNPDSIHSYIQSFIDADFSKLVTTHWHHPQKSAQIMNFPENMHAFLIDYLKNSGYQGLYSHQVDSFRFSTDHQNIVVSTGTSSGKTLCYNLPVLNALLQSPDSTAIYLFPTKALTEDQYKKLADVNRFFNKNFGDEKKDFIRAGIYDGDTNSSKRTAIRNSANIILTNPDMLHLGILPHHPSWATFFTNTKFVVLDEVHTYRGVFGSHVANVLRRLKRILKFYGSEPAFILSSATIQNPLDLASRLVEEEFVPITRDGSFQPERYYFFLNPPIVDPELGLRRGLIDQCVEIEQKALEADIQSIMFARSRKTVEITIKRIHDMFPLPNHPELHGYRSGYLAKERRQIESGLRGGIINAVVSTNALELGIDMGGVDAVIMMGYPGTIASFLQQSGRAGRRLHPSLSVLVASLSPIDQYIIRHPNYVRGKNPEKALLDPDNPLLLLNHLRCALFELPFEPGESFGNLDWNHIKPYLDVLHGLSQAVEKNEKFIWMSEGYPSNEISLRNISGQSFHLRLVMDSQSILIGEMDYQSAAKMIHPEAIYMHNGESYRVRNLDYETGEAELEYFKGEYITEPKVDTQVDWIEVIRQQQMKSYSKELAEIMVVEQVTGYKKVDWLTHTVLSHHELLMPEDSLRTMGTALKFSTEIVDELRTLAVWTNDANQYGSSWQKIRQLILERDQYRCQVCGQAGDHNLLHIHHKIPFRTIPDIEKANHPDNLTPLCPPCHKLAEQNVKIRSGLGGFAYLFTQITPLHLMCDLHDIGYFVDPVSKFNQNQPILVVYDQFPGGIGLAAELYNVVGQVLNDCKDVIESCECSDGCPACVGPAGENGYGGKEAALQIIRQLLKV
jgi:DEAD/DEAH box helicase domain-containing protein